MFSTPLATQPRRRARFFLLVAAMAAVGVCYWLLVYVTAEPPERDLFGSPFYWPGWLALPAVTALAGWLGPHRAALAYGVAALIPQAVAVVVFGAWLHQPQEYGASFWPLGLLFVLVHMAVAMTAAAVASVIRRQPR